MIWLTLGLALVAVAATIAAVQLRRTAARERRLREDADAARARGDTELARLVASFAGLGSGLIVLDQDGRVVAVNPSAQELASLPPQGCRGRPFAELVPWPALGAALDACHTTGTAQEFELEEHAAESSRSLAVRVRLLAGLGYVVGIEDRSRLRRLESLRRDFVANVSHELKTPLAAIQGYVETMLDDREMPPATRQRFLEKIARQSERLARLVGDLLTLSRLDEVELAGSDEPTDLVAVVKETARDLGALAERRGVQLHVEVPDRPAPIRGDVEALRQVVGNLIDNAVKYTPGGGRVSVHVRPTPGQVELEVRDTGIGLSPADQDRVFERFYRVDRARSREVGGTGLGLSIVKNTVRSLGGEVGVRSRLGQGSTFWVRLPVIA